MSEQHEVGGRILVYVDPDLEDLIPGFLANRQQDLSEIRKGVRGGDFALVRRVGHSMKGAGAAYGFDGLSEVGAKIEVAALEADVEAIDQLSRALAAYLEQVEVIGEQALAAERRA